MVTVADAGAPGILAFVISERLTRADYQDVLLPPIAARIERGEDLRALAVIEDFHGLESAGLVTELKAAARLGSGQRSIAIAIAVVSDIDWVRRSLSLFGWLVPGEVRVFTGEQRAAAEAWLAGV
ncbi:STAS/SEC14 domain-containing protein [Solirubrobacter sp. CPCC 204708]|uniref:STAS/SEC14 domain-containing protein n=1 Tax=Solirubrobacter deserti TaxID=2282478 RepID=A0ABT4RF21_9ACTN|nr:STAS/SEC14 domain-containing protein [Solirubrobacter deserti]MBE2319575.1 STAS/SEC14 domain-containing protein [Solirubrobacter deserti]MDA0137138.1 STAS/SEC14 domain-containing protein [Solirubrobacter deserti]